MSATVTYILTLFHTVVRRVNDPKDVEHRQKRPEGLPPGPTIMRR